MKRILIVFSLLTLSLTLSARDYPVGASLSMFGKEATQENLDALKAAGIEWIEVVMNSYQRTCPENEGYIRAFQTKAMIEKAGLKVWSCHLPFSRKLDISVTDPKEREKNVQIQERMIELASIFEPKRIVLHPSSEPIEDSERPARLTCSRNSIGRLYLAVKKTGAVLCIEDLPRTCLGRESSELLYLIQDYPEVMVCFDTNHLLTPETHDHFFEVLGNRIATVHVSDYDRVDERHFLEGKGCIDWPAFLANLKKYGYKGVFMHEVRSGADATPENIVKAYREVVCEKN